MSLIAFCSNSYGEEGLNLPALPSSQNFEVSASLTKSCGVDALQRHS